MRSPFPASNEVPAKQIASKHPTPSLSSGPLPNIPAPDTPAIRSQQSVPSGNSRQLPAQAFTSRARNTHKLPQAPLPPSECPAVFRAPGNPPNAPPPFPAKHSPASPLRHARPPRNPEHLPASRNPQIPPGIPKHKQRSRHCAGSAPNYLQVSTRSYLSRSESGSGSCSSPYC